MESIENIITSSYADTKELSLALKSYLGKEETRLVGAHSKPDSGLFVTREYTKIVDQLLTGLLEKLIIKNSVSSPFSMVAVGGYGRGELNLRSDIDLMFLYSEGIPAELETLSKEMLYVLWDAGLDVAFGIRSIDECMKLSTEDSKTKTSLLDMRFLGGSSDLYETFERKCVNDLFTGKGRDEFVKDKLEERKTRHAKYGDSVYILEPNVKEGEGGLRDIHSANWIARAVFGRGVSLQETGILTAQEAKTISVAFDFLLWVRNDLHFKVGRKNDQLKFDSQERIALSLGHSDTKEALAVEAFMQQYYRHAQSIARITSSMIRRTLSSKSGKKSRHAKTVDGSFVERSGRLYASMERVFTDSPVAMMKAIETAVRSGIEMDQTLLDLIGDNLHLIGDGFRSSPETSEIFFKMLNGPSPYAALSLMHRTGLLDKYIPEFALINCKAQHDMYHVYTVDAHSLFAVREAEKLSTEYSSRFRQLSELYCGIEDKTVLLLGILFHDIGKSVGKGHAEKGALMIPGICKRLGLKQEDIDTIAFLVRYHLIIADTAQYRDIHDEKLIIDFVKKVGDVSRLGLLYILTFCDVRAVGPDVWSQWKGTLFQELYFRALTVLERGAFELEDVSLKITKVMEKVKELAPKTLTDDFMENHSKMLPPRYFLSNTPKSIVVHMKLIKELGKKPVAMSFKQIKEREYTEITVATDDIHGLFSMITGVMLANSVNILGAQINTLRNGIALDVFQVNNVLGELLTDKKKHRKLESDLIDVVTGKVRVEKLAEKAKPSILDNKNKPKVKASVAIDNDVSDVFTVVDIHAQDRLGLLYRISSTMTKMGVFIHIAKISTKGDAATDILYIRDIFGQKVLDDKRVSLLKENLLKAIS